MSQHQLEIERKYELYDLVAPVPDIPWNQLESFTPREAVVENLDATYFDTASHVLGRARVAVRRRIGGYDQGWHIKFDDADGARHEVHFALLSQAKRQPAAVGKFLAGVTLGEALEEAVSVKTRRVRTVVEDSSGEPIGEICQDSVHAYHAATEETRIWNEWEIEIINPDSAQVESFFEQCEFLLADAGIEPSHSVAKVARALGQDAEFEARRGKEKPKKAKGKKNKPVETSLVVQRFLETALQNIALNDLKVRAGVEGASEQLHQNLLGLRALLRFGIEPYLENDEAEECGRQMDALVAALSAPQAAGSVLHELAEIGRQKEVSALPGAALEDFSTKLREEKESAEQQARAFLSSESYLNALRSLRQLQLTVGRSGEFPLNPENYFNKVAKRLRKALLAYRESLGEEALLDIVQEVQGIYQCFELLQKSSISWTAGQLELRAVVAEIARLADELAQEALIQNWCAEKSAAQNLEAEDYLMIGFIWGKSSYYESGLRIAFMNFVRPELDMLKKLKMK